MSTASGPKTVTLVSSHGSGTSTSGATSSSTTTTTAATSEGSKTNGDSTSEPPREGAAPQAQSAEAADGDSGSAPNAALDADAAADASTPATEGADASETGQVNGRCMARTTVSQDVQTRFPVLLAFFLSKIKGIFNTVPVSWIQHSLRNFLLF